MDITERNLWDGSEPGITSAVRGSNIESGGSWNPEDAELFAEWFTSKSEDIDEIILNLKRIKSKIS